MIQMLHNENNITCNFVFSCNVISICIQEHVEKLETKATHQTENIARNSPIVF